MHASNIRAWCGAVDKRYKDFASRMDKYGMKLKETLGVHQEEEVVKKVQVQINVNL